MAEDHKIETDEISGTRTTGHEWDGIKELDTPMPRWWLTVFYACIVWAVGYCIAYPAWPLISSYTTGVLGYSSRAEVIETVAEHKAGQAQFRDRIAAASMEEIRAEQDLFEFALASGASAYAVNCSTCHGAGAAGGNGYPNLNDDAWIWGGTIDDIHYTITHGIRNDTDEARVSEMPAFGELEILDDAQIESVTQFVLSLSGSPHDATLAGDGAVLYEENCAACHGEQGEGYPELGAPNLADQIWLFGGTPEAIAAQIHKPRQGVMPAWGPKLDEATIKELAVYVHALGGGQ